GNQKPNSPVHSCLNLHRKWKLFNPPSRPNFVPSEPNSGKEQISLRRYVRRLSGKRRKKLVAERDLEISWRMPWYYFDPHYLLLSFLPLFLPQKSAPMQTLRAGTHWTNWCWPKNSGLIIQIRW